MSRSRNTELTNPALKFYGWSGSKGKLKSFDKSLGEKGEQVFTELPFTFLVLDKLTTITGFSDADASGFWSNEVRNIKTEKLCVKTSKGEYMNDIYANLAPVLNKGAAYCQSLYIAYKEDGKLVIGNLKLSGSAIGSWIEFCKGKKLYEIAVTITEAVKAKKGATEYFVPTYVASAVSEGTQQEAVELDKCLQEYLTAYFKRAGVEGEEVVHRELLEENHILPDTAPEQPEEPSDLPF